jgi:AraC-like DNA-binding protein
MIRERLCPPLSPSVRALVRHYAWFESGEEAAGQVRATPVRPQPFLQFVLGGEHRLRALDSGRVVRSQPATVIGLCTYRRYNLEPEGPVRLFAAHFQPGALRLLTGLDVSAITDSCIPADLLFGPSVHALVEVLACQTGLSGRVAAADAWFATLPRLAADPIDLAARLIRDGTPPADLSGLSGLSRRQVQRRFVRQVGTSPSVYARLCRLNAVIEMHEAQPAVSWTELAHANGYADQAHLTRDYRAFVREAPTRFRRWTSAHAG